MPISDSLEVAIGLSFVFFLASLVLTSIHEMIETVLKARGRNLYQGIIELFNDPADSAAGELATTVLYQHPLIRGLMRGQVGDKGFMGRLPSYIPSRGFVMALVDQASKGQLTTGPDGAAAAKPAPPDLPAIAQLQAMAAGIQNDQLREALLHAIDVADGDIAAARDQLEQWFDGAMDRVSGWYKRRSQRIIFTLGFVMAIALNVNTLVIANSLSTSASVRHAVLDEASALEKSCLAASKPCNGKDAIGELGKTAVPVGWGADALAQVKMPLASSWFFGWLLIVSGYLLTAFAVTLGAPFWFDVLNRLMVIRATVKPTEKSKDEASQDPQPGDAGKITVSLAAAADKPATPDTAAARPIDTAIYDAVPASSDRLFEDDEGAPVPGLLPPEIVP